MLVTVHAVTGWVAVLNTLALLVAGLWLCGGVAVALAMANDSCAGGDDVGDSLVCTGVPQVVGLLVLLAGYLGGVGAAASPLVLADAPGAGTGWLVLAAGVVAAPVIVIGCAWIPRHPIRRRRARDRHA